ncbi:hypothetical protein J6590_004079 [Homalodisca vitripennis]|nr:hypothetical protein J6590_004079 [Homalodisca vitripennis]
MLRASTGKDSIDRQYISGRQGHGTSHVLLNTGCDVSEKKQSIRAAWARNPLMCGLCGRQLARPPRRSAALEIISQWLHTYSHTPPTGTFTIGRDNAGLSIDQIKMPLQQCINANCSKWHGMTTGCWE